MANTDYRWNTYAPYEYKPLEYTAQDAAAMRQKYAQESAGKDDSADMSPDKNAVANQAKTMAQTGASSDSYAGKLALLGSMYTMNPYLGAAGTGLMAIDEVVKAKQRKRQAEAVANNARIAAIQNQMQSMTAAAKGLKI